MMALVLGGIRSGKSQLAEQMAQASGLDVVYIATATAGDEAMARRITRHQQQRPQHWLVVEESIALATALQQHAAESRCLLVDCLSLWLTNLLLLEDQGEFARERRALLDCVQVLPGQLIMVSTETGLGVVPMGELSRRFCDEAGLLHQDLAQQCEKVVLSVAGLPMMIKDGTGS